MPADEMVFDDLCAVVRETGTASPLHLIYKVVFLRVRRMAETVCQCPAAAKASDGGDGLPDLAHRAASGSKPSVLAMASELFAVSVLRP